MCVCVCVCIYIYIYIYKSLCVCLCVSVCTCSSKKKMSFFSPVIDNVPTYTRTRSHFCFLEQKKGKKLKTSLSQSVLFCRRNPISQAMMVSLKIPKRKKTSEDLKILDYFDPNVMAVSIVAQPEAQGPLCCMMAFFTASYQHLLWTPTH